ncbi:hypothetical protein Are01nite_61390 [Actinoplanes regularis]|nr:hypothetical protein Are01nite_61390 [Actinoplanes regularis]
MCSPQIVLPQPSHRQKWHRFTTLALAALAVLAICAAEARRHDQGQPDMIQLTVNEIRRLINVFLVQASPTVCAGHAGDADTRRERDEPTTPAASALNSSHDHEWCLPRTSLGTCR